MISVVLPCLNESQNIPVIYQELLQVLPADYEIIFVDDGSKDSSWQIILDLAEKNPKVKGLKFLRNFGHQLAIEAGLKVAKGTAVITMDADLQHPPQLIPTMIAKWQEGFAVIGTKRQSTEQISIFKKLSSKLFYWLFNLLSGFKLETSSSDFRLLDREVVTFLNSLGESPKFFRGLVAWSGFSSASIDFQAPARRRGRSSYSLNKMYELAILGITSCSLKPLKIIILLGGIVSSFSAIFFLITFIVKFINPTLFSSAALFGSFILANTGLIIIMLGILGIYNVSILTALNSRPTYLVAKHVGIND